MRQTNKILRNKTKSYLRNKIHYLKGIDKNLKILLLKNHEIIMNKNK